MYQACVGIDWATTEHVVCVLDSNGRRLSRFQVDHTEDGLDGLVEKLGGFGDRADVGVAIERPDGLVVDRLLEAGHQVIPVKPAAIRAYASAETPSGAKSDPADAETIAEYLRLKAARLDPLRPYSPQTRALRETCRTRVRLVRRRVRATNQLETTLGVWWPGALTAFPDLDTDIAMAFLTRYPSPEAAAHLGPKRMERFLDVAGYSGYGWRRSGQEMIDLIKKAPRGAGTGQLTASCKAIVVAQVATVSALRDAIKDLKRSIRTQLDEHPDAEIFLSLPHSGMINAAQMLAEWGDVRQAYPDPDSVAAQAGVSPVTRQSGKYRGVHFRWACNKWFRQAITTYADNSRHGNQWANDVYQRARARGCDHPHAIRILARAWIRIIWRCWIEHTPYNPDRHGNLQTLTG
jgi:transposase